MIDGHVSFFRRQNSVQRQACLSLAEWSCVGLLWLHKCGLTCKSVSWLQRLWCVNTRCKRWRCKRHYTVIQLDRHVCLSQNRSFMLVWQSAFLHLWHENFPVLVAWSNIVWVNWLEARYLLLMSQATGLQSIWAHSSFCRHGMPFLLRHLSFWLVRRSSCFSSAVITLLLIVGKAVVPLLRHRP